MKIQRRKFTAYEQAFIIQRANRCCEYCKFLLDYSHDAFHIEHILPLILGGTYDLENLALACDGCNSFKWTFDTLPPSVKTPIFNLYNP
jgi:5-methylcytosine-specific restriction endonuclease McrA